MSTNSDTPPAPDEPDDESLARPESHEFEELSQVFEAFLMSRERKDAGSVPQLTPEQFSQVLKQQADREQRDFDHRTQRERHRHELAILKQQEKGEAAAREGQFKNATLTYLPRMAVILVAIVLVGIALIVALLAAFGAKDQIPVILAFVSGLVGGALAGFGGGYATGKTTSPTSPKSAKKTS